MEENADIVARLSLADETLVAKGGEFVPSTKANLNLGRDGMWLRYQVKNFRYNKLNFITVFRSTLH